MFVYELSGCGFDCRCSHLNEVTFPAIVVNTFHFIQSACLQLSCTTCKNHGLERCQHVLRDLTEAYQKVSILPIQTWTLSFEPIKKANIKKNNNKEILDTSNNRGHSFMTSIVANSHPFSSSKSIQFWSDTLLFCNTMDFHN